MVGLVLYLGILPTFASKVDESVILLFTAVRACAPPCQLGFLSTTLFGAVDHSDFLPGTPLSLKSLYSASTPCRNQETALADHATLP